MDIQGVYFSQHNILSKITANLELFLITNTGEFAF
jgi:hypothetical protein